MAQKNGYSQFTLGDMLLQYNLDEQNRMSMTLIPQAMEDRVMDKTYTPEPLVQIHAKGGAAAQRLRQRAHHGLHHGHRRNEVCEPEAGRQYDHHNAGG